MHIKDSYRHLRWVGISSHLVLMPGMMVQFVHVDDDGYEWKWKEVSKKFIRILKKNPEYVGRVRVPVYKLKDEG